MLSFLWAILRYELLAPIMHSLLGPKHLHLLSLHLSYIHRSFSFDLSAEFVHILYCIYLTLHQSNLPMNIYYPLHLLLDSIQSFRMQRQLIFYTYICLDNHLETFQLIQDWLVHILRQVIFHILFLHLHNNYPY